MLTGKVFTVLLEVLVFPKSTSSTFTETKLKTFKSQLKDTFFIPHHPVVPVVPVVPLKDLHQDGERTRGNPRPLRQRWRVLPGRRRRPGGRHRRVQAPDGVQPEEAARRRRPRHRRPGSGGPSDAREERGGEGAAEDEEEEEEGGWGAVQDVQLHEAADKIGRPHRPRLQRIGTHVQVQARDTR